MTVQEEPASACAAADARSQGGACCAAEPSASSGSAPATPTSAAGGAGSARDAKGGCESPIPSSVTSRLRKPVLSRQQEAQLDRILPQLADVYLPTKESALLSLQGRDIDQELKVWECFAKVLTEEVSRREAASNETLSLDDKRCLMADLLVWAEVTREGYKAENRAYVVGSNAEDPDFASVGTAFAEQCHAAGVVLHLSESLG